MRRVKVKTDYSRLRDSALAILAGKVAECMENNINFSADIRPTATELLLATEDYRVKHEKAFNGGSTLDKNLKKESKSYLLHMLNHLAHSVNVEAEGDAVALSSTGLLFNKQPEAWGEAGMTGRVRLRDSQVSGQCLVDFDKIPQVFEYDIEVGEMDTMTRGISWSLSYRTTSSKGTLITGLTPTKWYYVRVRGRNRLGAGDWSHPVSMIIR